MFDVLYFLDGHCQRVLSRRSDDDDSLIGLHAADDYDAAVVDQLWTPSRGQVCGEFYLIRHEGNESSFLFHQQ